MFYRLDEDGAAVESFEVIPDFHPDLVAGLVESEEVPVQGEVWDGSAFKPKFTETELGNQATANANAKEIAILDELDAKSIRPMREWIAAQPSAPQELKDREALAVAARSRII